MTPDNSYGPLPSGLSTSTTMQVRVKYAGKVMQEDFEAQLEQAKLDAMKELAYGASHEINNPLANISARAQSLLRDEENSERRQALEAIHQQAMRAHEMISDLMLFARPPQLNIQVIDVTELLQKVVEKFAAECKEREIHCGLNIPTAVAPYPGDQQQLLVAMSALFANAIEAIGTGGNVRISLENDPNWIKIEVSDTGPGISEEVRNHIFDPFYSGREAGRGLGFGLSKCWRIVTDHGGSVAANNCPSSGACMTVTLPR